MGVGNGVIGYLFLYLDELGGWGGEAAGACASPGAEAWRCLPGRLAGEPACSEHPSPPCCLASTLPPCLALRTPHRRVGHADGPVPVLQLRRRGARLLLLGPPAGAAGGGAGAAPGHGRLRGAPAGLPGEPPSAVRGCGCAPRGTLVGLGVCLLPAGCPKLPPRFAAACNRPAAAGLAPPQALPLLPSAWLVLPVELLQGCTFALAWSAGTVQVKRIAPPHLRSTVQSLFQGLYTGIGGQVDGGGLASERWCLNLHPRLLAFAVLCSHRPPPPLTSSPHTMQVLAWEVWSGGCCTARSAPPPSFGPPPWRWRLAGWAPWPSCACGAAAAEATLPSRCSRVPRGRGSWRGRPVEKRGRLPPCCAPDRCLPSGCLFPATASSAGGCWTPLPMTLFASPTYLLLLQISFTRWLLG